ncbi:MAG: hypothetical protein PHC53_01310 [Patescibacteria group bacterium]|nr:hypothetical protein [Patescibacteria group bacterium]
MHKPMSLVVFATFICALLVGCGGGGDNVIAPPAQDASPTQDVSPAQDVAAETDCTPGAKQCNGLIPQICDANGAWQDGTACQYACANGACTGTCAPGSKQCKGKTPQTCDTNATWLDGTTCQYVCQNGACVGECTPESKKCNGQIPQTCDANGAWQNGAGCPFICQDGACLGACAPGSKQCDGQIPQTCDANGAWQDGTACQYACASGVCAGTCMPGSKQCDGNTPQMCDTNGEWQSTAACSGEMSACCKGDCVAMAATISVGQKHTCAIKTDGTLWCWGNNNYGEVGNGLIGQIVPTPTLVQGLGSDVLKVSAGGYGTCAIKTDGTLWCWGANDSGQLGIGTTDGETCFDRTCKPLPQKIDSFGTDVVEVSVGNNFSCAIKTDGTLWCWGWNSWGQVGTGTQTNHEPSPLQVTAMGTNVVQVSTGYAHTCAVKTDGTLWCWGHNHDGEIGLGSIIWKCNGWGCELIPVQVSALGSNVAQAFATFLHTCARKTDGTVWCWGTNPYGQIGDGTIGGDPKCGCQPTPSQVSLLGTQAADLSAGMGHACARKNDGTLWCWGSGVVGDGTLTGALTPVQVAVLNSDVAGFSAGGDNNTCAIKTNSTLWCWGDNTDGQIGNGTTSGQTCGSNYYCEPLPVQADLICQ